MGDGGGVTWRETWRRLRQDARRLRRYQSSKFGYAPLTWFLDPAWQCVLLHRVSHLMWQRGHKKTGRLFMQINSLATGADIQPASDLGGGLLIPSPCGLNISGKAGANLVALALAGIGGSVRDRDIGAGLGLPVLGDNVVAGQFTGIQGSIRLGHGVIVEAGAGAVVSIADAGRMALAVEPRPGAAPCPGKRLIPSAGICGHARWRRTWADFAADVERYAAEASRHGAANRRASRLGTALSNPLLALLVYRVSHWLALNRHPHLALVLCQLNLLLHKLTIPPGSCLGGGAFVPHLAGTMFAGRAGAGLTLYASSLCAPLGDAFTAASADSPVLGDGVMVGGQSGAIGPIAVGDRVQLGPKVQLTQDAGEGAQVWSSMARGTDRGHRRPCETPTDSAEGFFARALPADARWRETRRRLRQDRARLVRPGSGDGTRSRLPSFPALTCVRLFRLSHYFYAAGWRRPARWCWLANVCLTGADISPACELGGGLFIPHPAGISLHCRAGGDLTVMATSGIATALDAEGRLPGLDRAPLLGDGVLLSAHSGIYGAVTVGSGVRILPGCIVTKSVACDTTLVPRSLKFRRVSTEPARAASAADPENDAPVTRSAIQHETSVAR
jgi:serine O-acetyltransferase